MDFGTEHFYFQCQPYLGYIRGYNSTNLKSQTIFITGEEIGKAPVKEDDKKTDDTEKKDDADKKDETEKKDETTDESKKDETVDKSEAETQRVAHGKPTKDKTEKQSVVEVKASVPAISKLDGEYNSGVAKIQYYKVNGTNIVKDTEGNYTFDESKFETVDVKNISKDNGYVSFNLSPDWTGYIVTRTVDKAGNYGDVRVMSVKLENPPAPETPRATATPAPAEENPAPKLIVAAQAPTGVGLSANIVIPDCRWRCRHRQEEGRQERGSCRKDRG